MKKFWIVVLVISTIAVWILSSTGLELFFGINMPFIVINHEQFTCFGYNVPNEQQLGFVMISGMLLALPARTMHLAILKLQEINRKKKTAEENIVQMDEFESEEEFILNHGYFPEKGITSGKK